MALATALDHLWARLHALREPLLALSVSAAEDRPVKDAAMVADSLADLVTEIGGWLEGAIGAARHAKAHVGDSDLARQFLEACHGSFALVERRFWSDLASHERLEPIAALGRERPAWLGWSQSVMQSVVQCREPMHSASAALSICWQELAARLLAANAPMVPHREPDTATRASGSGAVDREGW